MKNEIVIAPMHDGELEQVASLFSASWRRTYPGLVPDEYLAWLSPAEAEKMWGEYLKEPGHFILVARTCNNGPDGPSEADGASNATQTPSVAGFAAAQPHYDLPGAGYLAALHVDAKYKGKGLGKRLIGAVARHLHEQGVKKLALAVIDGNDAALAVYKHLGAKVVDFRETNEGFASKDHILLWDDTKNLRAI